jgi:hypothetical protein
VIARRAVLAGSPWLWGFALATALCRPYFTYAPGEMHINHEGARYMYRVVEFRDLLATGNPFPQWASDFRGGLGSPYFGYYQPGFFYVASLVSTIASTPRAIAVTLWSFALLGYGGVYAVIRTRFGRAAGVLAGTALITGTYPRAELYVRGDFSEFCGMMMLPVLLYWLAGWIEDGRAPLWRALAVGAGALVLMHPAAALLGYTLLAVACGWWVASTGRWRRGASGVGALVLGAALATFYWLPVALEWNLVAGERASTGLFSYRLYFTSVRELLGVREPNVAIQLAVGWPVLALITTVSALQLLARRHMDARAWRLVGFLWMAIAASVFLATASSTWIWQAVPLLQMVQFPWRVLLVLAVATALLVGCLPAFQQVIAPAGVLLLILTASPRAPRHPISHPFPTAAAGLMDLFFAPDAADEWLPRGAAALRGDAVPRQPACSAPCEVTGFERGQGWLRVRVHAAEGTALVLPHYFFPVGWSATLDGVPTALSATAEGLMAVHVPPAEEATVEATFAMTPMRRRGVAASAAALTAWVLAIVLRRPPRRPAARAP